MHEVVPTGEMAIGRVGNHPGSPRHLAEGDGLGAPGSRQRDTSLYQDTPQIAVSIGVARRSFALLDGHDFTFHTSPSLFTQAYVDSVHRLR